MDSTRHLESLSAEERELRIWEYIDGFSTAEERTAIGQLIAANAAWKSTYQELLQVQQLLQSADMETPSLRFTKNVMEKIAFHQIAPATRTYINKRIIWAIGIFFITVLAGFIVYGFSQMDWSSGGEQSSIPFNKIDTSKVDWSKLDITRFFNNNFITAFMMINIILALFFFDRFLANKKKEVRP